MKCGIICALAALALTGRAWALTVGGMDASTTPGLQGPIVAQQTSTFAFGGSYGLAKMSGRLDNWVVQETGGTYSFYYQIHIDEAERLPGGEPLNLPFLTLQTNLQNTTEQPFVFGYRTDLGGKATETLYVYDDGPGRNTFMIDAVVDYVAGDSTQPIVIRTGAEGFENLGTVRVVSSIGNTNGPEVASFQPAEGVSGAIPEPASVALLPLALAGLVWRRGRR